MTTQPAEKPRYEMVNVQLGYVIIEHDIYSRAMRSYFSSEPVPPKEEYREGKQIWKYSGMAQSFRFDLREVSSGEVVKFDELLGLLYYGCCKKDSEVFRVGEVAHDLNISLYFAITYEGPDGSRLKMPSDKLRALNRAFNDRLRTPVKKILILPDMFNLYQQISYGEIMIDFGLTSLEAEG
jgi:hypothetical protein